MGMERESEEASGLREEWLAVPANLRENGTSILLPERRARLWSLVLEARYLPFNMEKKGGGVILLVPARSFAASLEELRLFEKENRGWPPFQPLSAPIVENTLATLSVLILLATFYNLTLLDITIAGHRVDWVTIGNAYAGKIVHGEWWRLITALTLHADWLHLISNLTLGGIFIVFLCRELGSGLSWSLLLASGTLGNLANAFMQLPDHRSVGASTLVFGAVGILGAISVLRYRRELRKRWPLPIAAAIGLLALLGTEGKQTDLGAHLFGFVFGIILGLLAGILTERFGRPGKWLNASLAFLSALLVLFAWWSAILNGVNG
jgi:membrane associated rhomboid family serine protease